MNRKERRSQQDALRSLEDVKITFSSDTDWTVRTVMELLAEVSATVATKVPSGHRVTEIKALGDTGETVDGEPLYRYCIVAEDAA